MKEGKLPFDAQRKLHNVGVTSQEISTINSNTTAERENRIWATRQGIDMGGPDFLLGKTGLYSGDYQARLQDNLGFPPPYLETINTKTIKKGFPLRRRTEIKKVIQKKELQPIDIAQEIASYTKKVLTKGEQPVTIVDFGAGAAVTSTKAAHLLKADIHGGKARIIATNIDTAPDEADIPAIQRRYTPEHAANVVEALKGKTVTYAKADILELYDLLKGEPAHLLFMVDTLPFTEEYNETLLKITGDMLHPRYGTAIFTVDKSSLGYSTRGLSVIRNGLNELVKKGFKAIHPLQVKEGTVHPPMASERFPIEVYQGSDAPPFKLYTL